ncbi:hypothetical protein Droror1_Dr00027852 [Drosera rotundifolia]
MDSSFLSKQILQTMECSSENSKAHSTRTPPRIQAQPNPETTTKPKPPDAGSPPATKQTPQNQSPPAMEPQARKATNSSIPTSAKSIRLKINHREQTNRALC